MHIYNSIHRFTLLIASLATAIITTSQTRGVNPLGMSDRAVAQLKGNVNITYETIYNVDYSRHTADKGDFIISTETTYNQDGDIQTERTFDVDGMKTTGTLYQYRNGRKHVTTTKDAQGTRTLQMLYSYDDDKNESFMRFTDAIGVTISTLSVTHGEQQAQVTERYYKDGESITTLYEYDKNGCLKKITKTEAEKTTITTFSIKKNNLPSKSVTKSDNETTTTKYEYIIDDNGNWTQCITYINGKPVTIAERRIVYFQ